jgi:ribosomal protein S18 acetylase RimI-like enzyme
VTDADRAVPAGGRRPFHIRPLVASDAAPLADLRGAEISEGLLATLGPAARLAFFRAAVEDPDAFGFVADDDTGQVGYVLIASDVRRIERRALRSSPALLLAAGPRVLRGGGLRRALVIARGLVRPAGREAGDADPEPVLRLLDIVVAMRARGAGVGRALIEAGLAEASRRGHRAIGLSVVSSNAAAVGLYRATGFVTSRRGVRSDGAPYELMRAPLEPIDPSTAADIPDGGFAGAGKWS